MPISSLEQLPLIEVAGSPRRRGQIQGEEARSQIQQSLEAYRANFQHLTRLTWDQAIEHAQQLLPVSESCFTGYLEEIRGIAEGASVPFTDVWANHCCEELFDQPHLPQSCTCIGIVNGPDHAKHALLAHNEDWLIQDLQTVYLIRAALEDGRRYIALAYGALIANVGINSAGLAVAINSVHSLEVQLGVPRVVYARAVLDARSMTDAISACSFDRRAGGYSFLIAGPEGDLVCVESSAWHHRVHEIQARAFVHTNHYLDPGLRGNERLPQGSSSLHRYERAWKLVGGLSLPVQIQDMQDLLRDHDGLPGSICLHENPQDPAHEREGTIASIVMDPAAGTIWAAAGPPCRHDYFAYSLA